MTERAPKTVDKDVIVVGIEKYTSMKQQAPRVDPFKEQLRESLQQERLNSRAVKIARHANVYTCGDQDEMVYFIESGQIKLLMLSPEGKECLLAIHSAGDIFGELCLSGLAQLSQLAAK